jgi:hypothetical protein
VVASGCRRCRQRCRRIGHVHPPRSLWSELSWSRTAVKLAAGFTGLTRWQADLGRRGSGPYPRGGLTTVCGQVGVRGPVAWPARRVGPKRPHARRAGQAPMSDSPIQARASRNLRDRVLRSYRGSSAVATWENPGRRGAS